MYRDTTYLSSLENNGEFNCIDCNLGIPSQMPLPVGSYKFFPLGLYDVLGNVAEWQCLGEDYIQSCRDGNSDDQIGGASGGAWNYRDFQILQGHVDRLHTEYKNDSTGFRVVKEVENK